MEFDLKNYLGVEILAGWKSVESVPKLVEDYMNKKLMVDEFVTHTLPFEQINEAFDLMHAGKRFETRLVTPKFSCLKTNIAHLFPLCVSLTASEPS